MFTLSENSLHKGSEGKLLKDIINLLFSHLLELHVTLTLSVTTLKDISVFNCAFGLFIEHLRYPEPYYIFCT